MIFTAVVVLLTEAAVMAFLKLTAVHLPGSDSFRGATALTQYGGRGVVERVECASRLPEPGGSLTALICSAGASPPAAFVLKRTTVRGKKKKLKYLVG